jgi:hypothetical protein
MRSLIKVLFFALAWTGALSAIAQVPNPTEQSPEPTDQPAHESAAGHGDISIGYLNTYVNGFWMTSNQKVPNGIVRSQGITFQVDYNVSNDWSVTFGIPFLRNRYEGNSPHCPTATPIQCVTNNIPALNPPHPESNFIDDGKAHGTWQDFTIGTAYHTNIQDYYITPSLTATIPSHDYVFFDNAAVGQRLRQLMVAATLSHQFDFSELYYKLGYGYVFSQKVLGYNTGYQRFDGELGYFVNEKFTVRTSITGRLGNGFAANDPTFGMLIDGATSDYWYHHDQLSEHNYFGAGIGFDYQFARHYTLTAGIQREFWGETVFDFKYALETRLTRDF